MLEPHDCQLETPLEKDKKKSQKQAHDMREKKNPLSILFQIYRVQQLP